MDDIVFLEIPRRSELRRRGPALMAFATVCWTMLLFALLADPARFASASSGLTAALGLTLMVRLIKLGTASSTLRLCAWWMLLCIIALYLPSLVSPLGWYAAGTPVFVLGIWLALKSPAASLIATCAIIGASGSIKEYTPLPVGIFLDVLLVGMWIAGFARFAVGARRNRVVIVPATWLVLVLALASVVQLICSPAYQSPFISFRGTIWYVMALLIVAYSEWTPALRRVALRGIVGISLLVGAYAVFRMATGPTAKESAYTIANEGLYSQVAGEARAAGSLPAGQILAIFCAIMLPMLFAVCVAIRGRLRVASGVAAALLVIALFGSQTRSGLVAAIGGLGLVLVGTAAMRALPPWRVAGAVVIGALAVIVGVGGFLYSTNNKPEKRDRYVNLVNNPGQDPSVVARKFKWKDAIDDINSKPFGHGFGSGGGTFARTAKYQSIETFNLDNSYLFIAYQQGWAVLVLFGITVVLLLVALIGRGVSSVRRLEGAIAVGAAGSLLAFAIALVTAEYFEGYVALLCWLMVGFGLSGFTGAMDAEPEDEAESLQPDATVNPSPARQLAPA